MYIDTQWLRKLLAFLFVTFTLSNFWLTAHAAVPWWHNLQLDWKPFTALPTIANPNRYQWYWDIQERSGNGTHKFFAQSVIWNSPGKFLMADSSVTPVFVEASTNLSSIGYATSAAMARWNNPYDEFFLGSSTGLWRFDEGQNQFVSVWYWDWDPTYIVSLGNAIYGRVGNCGSQSGYHVWGPGGSHTFSLACGTSDIWGDPISGNHGIASRFVRVVSTNLSIVIVDQVNGGGGLYSFDGGLTYNTPVGVRNDGLELYISDFYGYSGSNIIVKARSYGIESLFIGPLGGTLYPLSFPTNTLIGTLFYSPSTRLLIAGDATSTNLYYAVLPASDYVLPELQIQKGIIVSWPTNYSTATLQDTTNLNGGWQEVTIPRIVVGDEIRVSVPVDSSHIFFRLLLP